MAHTREAMTTLVSKTMEDLQLELREEIARCHQRINVLSEMLLLEKKGLEDLLYRIGGLVDVVVQYVEIVQK